LGRIDDVAREKDESPRPDVTKEIALFRREMGAGASKNRA
jgi:hypothetical protein